MDNSTNRSTGSIESLGGIIPDGRTVDLIRDEATGRLKLLCLDGTQYRAEDSISVQGRTLDPPAVDAAVQSAMTWPTKASGYGSTEGLFTTIKNVFTEYGFSTEVAKTVTYFLFSAWFPEPWSPAPSLIVTGANAAAALLLQLLGCLARRALPVSDMGPYGFRGLIQVLHPTVVIDASHFTPRSLRKLLKSCESRVFAPWKGSVAESCCAKAIYAGPALDDDIPTDFSVRVHLSPVRRGAPMLDERKHAQIIADLQPQLLGYRMRNLDKVRKSDFDLPELEFEARQVACLLGRAIVDAPDIQAGVQALLETRENDLRAARWTDVTCVIIEALLDACHDPKANRIYVREIAEKTAVIFRARGVSRVIEPRAVGATLRRLGFVPKRNGAGYWITANEDVRSMIHCLARDYIVAAVESGIAACVLCTETFKTVPRKPGDNVHGQKPL